MEIKRIFYVFITVIFVVLCCKNSTEPEINIREYIITQIHGMTVEEFAYRYYEAPVVERIKLENYKIGSADYKGQVLLRDIGWLDIKPFSTDGDKFIVYTLDIFDKYEHLWFRIQDITKDQIEGVFAACGSTIDPFLVEFSGSSQKEIKN
ncbi:hypothetical protein ACFL4T_13640 [candidate division KSB1 bacterium]